MRTIEELKKLLQTHAHDGTDFELTPEEHYLLMADTSEEEARIETALEGNDLETAAEIISFAGSQAHRQQRLLLKYARAFSDPAMLFDLIIDVYTMDGYDFPKFLIQTAKRISRQIPPEHRLKGLPGGDPVTIWRGTYDANPKHTKLLRTAVSWTTDKTMAVWFANRIENPGTKNGRGAVWEATISRSKIIAFTQERDESEVLQHMNVQNPHVLDISPEEWEAALRAQDEARKK